MNRAPIELTFYDQEDNPVKTYSRRRIPSYLLDSAIEIQASLDNNSTDKKTTDALFQFVTEFYGDQFTLEDLKKNTDLLECVTVLKAILMRASSLALEFAQENPPPPSPPIQSTKAGDGSSTSSAGS